MITSKRAELEAGKEKKEKKSSRDMPCEIKQRAFFFFSTAVVKFVTNPLEREKEDQKKFHHSLIHFFLS